MQIESRYSLNTYERNVQVPSLIQLNFNTVNKMFVTQIGFRITVYQGSYIFQHNSDCIT